MKCIITAMQEKEYRPRAKWWGYVKDDKRYLMRYHHCIAVFSHGKVLYTFSETKTDKAGLSFALDYYSKQFQLTPLAH